MSGRQSSGIHNYVTPEEYHAMRDAAESERERLLLDLLFVTGGRISEVLALRPGDVTNHDEIALVNLKQHEPAGSPKPRKFCIVPDDLVAAIQEYARSAGLRRADYLFHGRVPTEPMSRQWARKLLGKLAERAGVTKLKASRAGGDRETAIWPHAFRHGAAVNLIRQNVPPKVVQAQLGHKRLDTTDGYMEIFGSDRRAGMEQVKY